MRIGFHVSKRGVVKGNTRSIPTGIVEDMNIVTARGLSPVAQIFVTGPRNTRETLSNDDKTALAASQVPIVIHGAYPDNPWSGRNEAIANIQKEMRIAAEIGATGVIVHLAAAAIDEELFHRIIDRIFADAPAGIILWLETQAAKSSAGTYETPEKLRVLCTRIGKYGGRVGICIDTAHLSSCGNALTTYDDAAAMFDVIPIDMPAMIHLNDSASGIGSGVDRHEALCDGVIWKRYSRGGLPRIQSGLAYIAKWATERNAVVILERGHDPSNDLDIMAELVVAVTLH